MNKDKLKLWIDALRSGEYVQGREGLAKGGVFCCLGVACEVAIKDGLELEVQRHTSGSLFDEYDGESGFLPVRVQDWLGVTGGSPLVEWASSEDGTEHVAYLNDEKNQDFGQIADALEATYLKGESK